MLIARANPWICLGLAFFWLVLTFSASTPPDSPPTLPQVFCNFFFLYILLLSATFCTVATVAPENLPAGAGGGSRIWKVFRADVFDPARRTSPVRALSAGLATGMVLVALSLCISFLVGRLTEAAGREVELQALVDIFLRSPWPGRAALIVSAVLFTPVVEELFFRYTLESVLSGALRSRAKALFYGAVLFASMHGNLAAFPSLLLVSAGCSLAYRRTGSLLAPIGAHLCFNLASVALLLAGGGD